MFDQTNAGFLNQNLFTLIRTGGFAMIPLVVCSLLVWAVIFERLWNYRWILRKMREFHLQAVNALLRKDRGAVRKLCDAHGSVPLASLVKVAIDRLESLDPKVRSKWLEAAERQRQLVNQDLKRNLWVLGTIGSAAPFIGLFGTVIGILRSFQEIAKQGSGGFGVVAAGISESLVATAAGIVVAVVAVLAFNAFQTRWSHVVLNVRLHLEELTELLESSTENQNGT